MIAAALEGGQWIIEVIKKRMVYILAIILFVSGLYDIYTVAVANYADQWDFVDEIVSAVIKMVAAEFMVFDPKKSIMRAIGFYSMSLGITRIISSLSTLYFVSSLSLAIGGVMLVMGVNMLISSYNYLNDTTRGRTGITLSATVLALMDVLFIVLIFESNRFGLDPSQYGDMSKIIISLFEYITLLLIMDTKELRFSTSYEKSNTRIESARVTYTVAGDLTIDPEDAKVMSHMFDDRSSWKVCDNGGPVECEYKIRIIDGRIPSTVIMQKWKDSDPIHFTVVNDDTDSIILANRFSVHSVSSDGERPSFLRLFDEKRMIMQIAVRSEEEVVG